MTILVISQPSEKKNVRFNEGDLVHVKYHDKTITARIHTLGKEIGLGDGYVTLRKANGLLFTASVDRCAKAIKN